ncbi:MAG: pectate lyase [Pedobacter sp.]|nr:MAG: pectate lyase [Pedobacter sp.]
MKGVLLILISSFGFLPMACAQTLNKEVNSIDTLAEKVLVYQLDNGAWPKQLMDKSVVNYELALDAQLLRTIKATTIEHATIDNKATTREIDILLEAFQQTKNQRYLLSAKRGIAYLLAAQYENGGWPQYFPDKHLYRAQITYNDNAMVNVLLILLKVALQHDVEVLPLVEFQKGAATAVQKGVDCILKTQVKQHGQLSIWAAQYDPENLVPAQARAFEPISLSTGESVGIIRFLMKVPNPTPDIINAIQAGVNWFEMHKQVGFKYGRDASGKNSLIPMEGAFYWGRFYDIATNRIIFGDRDGSVKYNFDELSLERRNGYVWYGDFASKLLESEYPKWLKKIKA